MTVFNEAGLIHQVTYWAVGAVDGFGKETFAAPVLLAGKWKDIFIQRIQGQTVSEPIKTEVDVAQEVKVGGYLALGNFTGTADPQSIEEAKIIQQVRTVYSVQGIEKIIKARL